MVIGKIGRRIITQDRMIHHKELHVWQRSIEFVSDIYILLATFPKTEVYGLADQIKRASVSIPSNIAE